MVRSGVQMSVDTMMGGSGTDRSVAIEGRVDARRGGREMEAGGRDGVVVSATGDGKLGGGVGAKEPEWLASKWMPRDSSDED